RTPAAADHPAPLVLSDLKISMHPLSLPSPGTVFVVPFLADFFLAFFVTTVGRHAALRLHVCHRRAGKHSFRPRHVPAISADMDRANGSAIHRMQGHDPDRIAMLVGPQSVARAVKARSRFFGNMTCHLERAAGIEIQSRSVNGRTFG